MSEWTTQGHHTSNHRALHHSRGADNDITLIVQMWGDYSIAAPTIQRLACSRKTRKFEGELSDLHMVVGRQRSSLSHLVHLPLSQQRPDCELQRWVIRTV
mmetsp:Transcript_20116/g.61180  ORF Transcript_20116/g.61180 Transcript_20116/m.61180 type:complete len:100 (-) Transcript_20116:482-781(-)